MENRDETNNQSVRNFHKSYFRFVIVIVGVFFLIPLVIVAVFLTTLLPLFFQNPSNLFMIYLMPVFLISYMCVAAFWFFKRSHHVERYKSAIMQKAIKDSAPAMEDFKKQIRDEVIKEMQKKKNSEYD